MSDGPGNANIFGWLPALKTAFRRQRVERCNGYEMKAARVEVRVQSLPAVEFVGMQVCT